MKRIIATIGLLCVGLSGAGHETNAQVTINIFNLNDVLRAKPIDETRFTVQYQTTSMPDTLQPDKKEEETLMLKVGDKCSVYYSYAKFLTDSVLEADKAAGASQEVINEHLQQYSSKTNAQVYKNYPAGKTTTLDALAASRFRCEEKEGEEYDCRLLPFYEVLKDPRGLTEEEKKNLAAACRYFAVDPGESHRALSDALAAHYLYQELKNRYFLETPEVFAPEDKLYTLLPEFWEDEEQ